jgi:hypothetical protein
MMRNRIHSVLAMRLIEAPSPLFSGNGLEWLTKVELDPQARLLVDCDLRQLEFLEKEIDVLDAELARRGYASDAVKLLMTLPAGPARTLGNPGNIGRVALWHVMWYTIVSVFVFCA